jgi:hypothetical protein
VSHFAIRLTSIDVVTGNAFSTYDMANHGWASEAAARKAWKERSLFETDGYLLDFTSMPTAEAIQMIEFVQVPS